jgi:predicted acyltransferase
VSPVGVLRWGTRNDGNNSTTHEVRMIILGVVLLIIGFVASIPILWTIGIILVVIGLILALLGMAGHAVGGRRHYY